MIEVLKDTTPDPTIMEAYVDGSYNKKTKTYGYGCLIMHNGGSENIIGTGTNPLKATMRNVAGEIDGAMAAMSRASHTEGVKLLRIYHDYIGISKWCTGEWKTNKLWTKLYKTYYDGMIQKFKIEFIKVEAHSGNEFNDYADHLAKKACGLVE